MIPDSTVELNKSCGDAISIRSNGLLDVFKAELRVRNYSPKTIKTYSGVLRAFLRYFYSRHPRTISTGQIRGYLLYLLNNCNSFLYSP